ncbi:MAG: CDF family Co(II)/Ni(II) efflux transporter DmeF [bacterium]|nr:CDF family Co(II)/Ni(II) efflux transporter DmeF [bacterium]
MHSNDLSPWQHDHVFGQDRVRPGERRTRLVIALTAVTMGVEISGGVAFGSMALLADGLHMASHVAALAISAAAYVYARRNAHDGRFSFGTGKVNALAGYTGAVLLALFALVMAGESVARLLQPVAIAFDQAILVAVAGLLVNAVSVLILGGYGHSHGDHDHDEGHSPLTAAHDDDGHPHDGDHNLHSAYLHVLADALTSVLAIGALLTGKYFGLGWMDPAMGIVGAMLVARWSLGLVRDTSRVLLDHQAPAAMREAIRDAVEGTACTDRVVDLHVWAIGPELYAAALSVVSDTPMPPEQYQRRLLQIGVAHATIEVHQCPHDV